jgi:hypothetical protein
MDLLAAHRRVAVIGLAKNTGKTETLKAIIAALDAAGETVGVTSVGRDGEARDVLDPSQPKPRIRLAAGSLVATALPLMRRADRQVALLATTAHRTPLGSVAVGRLEEAGEIEVAGPGSAAAVADVCDLMTALGASRILIDGSFDRRAAANPSVSDAVVLATGAVLHPTPAEIVRRTAVAVALLRLPPVADPEIRAIARAATGHLVLGPDDARLEVPRGLALRSGPIDDPQVFEALGQATHLVIHGALLEPFLTEVAAARAGVEEPLTVVVDDASCVFLDGTSVARWAGRGLALEAVKPITLLALTVNPVAPGSHRLDSDALCAQLERMIPEVEVLDVLAPAPLQR